MLSPTTTGLKQPSGVDHAVIKWFQRWATDKGGLWWWIAVGNSRGPIIKHPCFVAHSHTCEKRWWLIICPYWRLTMVTYVSYPSWLYSTQNGQWWRCMIYKWTPHCLIIVYLYNRLHQLFDDLVPYKTNFAMVVVPRRTSFITATKLLRIWDALIRHSAPGQVRMDWQRIVRSMSALLWVDERTGHPPEIRTELRNTGPNELHTKWISSGQSHFFQETSGLV